MFTFALALFAVHRYFSLYFQPLSAFRGKGKKEFGRKHSGVECQIDRFACFAAYFSSFPKENAFQNEIKLMNYKPENRIP